jgi:hypothetical protein
MMSNPKKTWPGRLGLVPAPDPHVSVGQLTASPSSLERLPVPGPPPAVLEMPPFLDHFGEKIRLFSMMGSWYIPPARLEDRALLESNLGTRAGG